MSLRHLVLLAALPLAALPLAALPLPALPLAAPKTSDAQAEAEARAADLKARIEASPTLPFTGTPFAAKPPSGGWESGMVSWLALDDAKGLIYELQRGDKADPVLVLDRDGRVLRSWGKGSYKIPHSIRVDPAGNVWTVDAGASIVIKYSPVGEKLMTISVGEQPETRSAFNGTTDIAFGPGGRLFIADGYGNARVLEYSSDGKRVRAWGTPGSGPGQFKLPHSIQIDEKGVVYVADRENGRIQKFDLDGKYLGEIPGLGRTYSLKLAGNVLWAGMQQLNEPTGAPGWVVKLDRNTGKMLGHLDVADKGGLHSMEQTASGEPITVLANQLMWFHAK
jgi:DNA-binding beta-propeller fold protein YncE